MLNKVWKEADSYPRVLCVLPPVHTVIRLLNTTMTRFILQTRRKPRVSETTSGQLSYPSYCPVSKIEGSLVPRWCLLASADLNRHFYREALFSDGVLSSP